MTKRFEAFALETRKTIKTKKAQIRRDLKARYARGEGNGKEDPVTDSVYLVIPAFDADLGARPVPQGTAVWHSPAVNVVAPAIDPTTPLEILQNRVAPQLTPGQTYEFEAWVMNRGDMVAPAVNVEFYKRLPGFGATVESSEFLGASVIPIDRNSQARATLTYTARPENAGHWCLHARATSFNPPDAPADWSSLSARHHRHVGQQNITVLQASTSMMMMVTAPNTGRRTSKNIRVQVFADDAPPRIARDKCLAEGLAIKKGNARSKFKLSSQIQFKATPRTANSWNLSMTKGETGRISLHLPAHVSGDKSMRTYSIRAFEQAQNGKLELIDGVSLLIAP